MKLILKCCHILTVAAANRGQEKAYLQQAASISFTLEEESLNTSLDFVLSNPVLEEDNSVSKCHLRQGGTAAVK